MIFTRGYNLTGLQFNGHKSSLRKSPSFDTVRAVFDHEKWQGVSFDGDYWVRNGAPLVSQELDGLCHSIGDIACRLGGQGSIIQQDSLKTIEHHKIKSRKARRIAASGYWDEHVTSSVPRSRKMEIEAAIEAAQ